MNIQALSNSLLHRPLTEFGNGPSLLFVHGAWLGAWTFGNYMKYFESKGITAAAIDLRGHGGLPQDDRFLTSGQREMAEDVVEACAALGEVVVVGHSAGAAIAAIAASRGASVGLALLAPSPPAQLPGLKILPAEPEGAPVPPGSLAQIRAKFVANHDVVAARSFAARLVGESPALLNDRRLLRVPIDRAGIMGPTLCLAAEREAPTFHAPGQDQATAAFFDAEFHLLHGASHCFMLETDWEYSAEVIHTWYDRHFRQ